MTDFNKIKKIMKDSVEKKLVIVDGEDSFVIITLDEYQQLIERSNLVSKIQGKVTEGVAGLASSTDYKPPISLPNRTAGPENTTEGEIRDVNRDLDRLTDFDSFEPEIRYEKLNNEYSEEPI